MSKLEPSWTGQVIGVTLTQTSSATEGTLNVNVVAHSD